MGRGSFNGPRPFFMGNAAAIDAAKGTIEMKSWTSRFFRGLIGVILILFGIATVGSFVPAISILGELGPVLTSLIGLWAVIFSFIGGLWALNRWRKGRRKRACVAAIFGLFAAFGMSFIQYQQIRVAEANGADIHLPSALFAGTQIDPNLKFERVNYTRYEGQELPLDIYRPTAPSNGKLAPVFVYIHGGGWVNEDLKQRQADFRWFAKRGYLVISLEYTLATDTRHTWNMAEPQLGCALAWVNANAARYGGDASRLAVWGESAGGNLALNVTYRISNGTMQAGCAGDLPQIDAVVALYPVVDPARMYRPEDPLLGLFGRNMGDKYTGGSPVKFPSRYTAIASATHISAKAPPTFMIIPEADHLVAPDAAYRFANQARAAGVPVQLVRMPFAEHAFDLPSGGIGNQFVRQSMAAFLNEKGLRPKSGPR
jgi:acetyl esterase